MKRRSLPPYSNKPNNPMPGLEQHKLVQASPIKLTPGDQQHRRVHAGPTTKCQAACSKGKPNKPVPGRKEKVHAVLSKPSK